MKLKAKLLKAQNALDAMGDEIYLFYCELVGMDRSEIVNHLLIKVDTDELLETIDDNGDGHKDAIEWTRTQLKKFKGILERFANETATASDLQEILSKFEIKIKLQTERVDGKVEFMELRSYERAVDPELERQVEERGAAPGTDTRVSPFVFFLYTALYDFLVVKKRRLSVCAAAGCGELVPQERLGRERLYHSHACQVREYRRRKKASI